MLSTSQTQFSTFWLSDIKKELSVYNYLSAVIISGGSGINAEALFDYFKIAQKKFGYVMQICMKLF